MMKKIKRYNAGGTSYEDTDDAKNLEAAAEREKADAEKPAEPLKMASFKEAFAEALIGYKKSSTEKKSVKKSKSKSKK